jgi:hypothetical protein
MMFILPGIGAALGGAFTGAAGALATNTLGGALGAVGQAAGKVMQFVGNTVSKAGNVFNNVTKGVTDTLGNFAKTAGKNLGLKGEMFTNAADNFFTGGDSAFSRSVGESSRFANLTADPSKFTKAIEKTVTGTQSDFGSLESIDKYSTSVKPEDVVSFEDYAVEGTIKEIPINKRTSILSPETKTFSQKLAEAPKKLYEGATKKIETFLEDPAEVLFDDFGEKITQGVQSKSLQALGLEDKPMAPVYNQYAAYVPTFNTAPQGSYGAPEIMNARSFEQQVMNNPNPYGYTAFQYDNYMAQTA